MISMLCSSSSSSSSGGGGGGGTPSADTLSFNHTKHVQEKKNTNTAMHEQNTQPPRSDVLLLKDWTSDFLLQMLLLLLLMLTLHRA